MLSILATLLTPDRGRVTVLGHDVVREASALRRRLNMVSGHPSFLWSLRVGEIVAFYGRLYGLSGRTLRQRVDSLIELCELVPYRRVPYSDLSTGLKQRVALAKALVNEPELLFLDEPTLGLDPDVAVRVRAHVARLRRIDSGSKRVDGHAADAEERYAAADGVAGSDTRATYRPCGKARGGRRPAGPGSDGPRSPAAHGRVRRGTCGVGPRPSGTGTGSPPWLRTRVGLRPVPGASPLPALRRTAGAAQRRARHLPVVWRR